MLVTLDFAEATFDITDNLVELNARHRDVLLTYCKRFIRRPDDDSKESKHVVVR